MNPNTEPANNSGAAAYPEVRKFLREVEMVARVGAETEDLEGVWASLVVLHEQLQITTEMLGRRTHTEVAG